MYIYRFVIPVYLLSINDALIYLPLILAVINTTFLPAEGRCVIVNG